MVPIDGKSVSEKIRAQLKAEVAKLPEPIGLAVILVGDDAASAVYVKNKIQACEQVGIKSYHYRFPADAEEAEIEKKIKELNENKSIKGILVQLPMPKKFNKQKILSYIDPKKDVDGFSPYQIGRLLLDEECLVSCTPQGIMQLLDEYNIPIEGKNAVVIGRSNIVGKPIAVLLLQRNATVTICHSKTVNLAEITKKADILVVAIKQPKYVTADMVKEGAVVIDVGINRTENGLCGDVDYENVAPKCSFITPVPGGVGPMTVTSLLYNTVKAAKYDV